MKHTLLAIYGLSIILGLFVGLLGALFQVCIKQIDNLLSIFFKYAMALHWPVALVSAAISGVMVTLAWLMVRYISPEASGSGIPDIEEALSSKRTLDWKRLLPIKFIGGILSISSKMVLGREGPTIQMGGYLGEMLGQFTRFNRKHCDLLITAGAAAGLTTAFNAPLAGVLFVLEEMHKEWKFSFISFKVVALSCLFASISLNCIIGIQPVIATASYNLPPLYSLWIFPIFGLLVGLVGLGYNIGMIQVLAWSNRLNHSTHLLFAFLIGAGMGYFAIRYPSIVSGGYPIIKEALTMMPGFKILILVLLLRFIISILCYSAGVPGGIFAPMLALGTLLGLLASMLLNVINLSDSIQPGVLAIVGMAAFFSASVQSPLTGIILVVEMTQNYNLILPLMLSCFSSAIVVELAKNHPIYEQFLRLKKSENNPHIRYTPRH